MTTLTTETKALQARIAARLGNPWHGGPLNTSSSVAWSEFFDEHFETFAEFCIESLEWMNPDEDGMSLLEMYPDNTRKFFCEAMPIIMRIYDHADQATDFYCDDFWRDFGHKAAGSLCGAGIGLWELSDKTNDLYAQAHTVAAKYEMI